VGIGETRGPLPPVDGVLPNSADATKLLLQRRKENLASSGVGLMPAPSLKRYRLPLVIKYHKPAGMMGSLQGGKRALWLRDDLRLAVYQAPDRFELDIYHPVGTMEKDDTGLILWSRLSDVTERLDQPGRGAVCEWEAIVSGDVDDEGVRARLRRGVPMGEPGFKRPFVADLRRSEVIEESSIQDPRSRVVVAVAGSQTSIRPVMREIGHGVCSMKRIQFGAFSLGDLKEGEMVEATADEEEWVCNLVGLAKNEYPAGRLPAPRDEEAAEGGPAPGGRPDAAAELVSDRC